MGSKDLPETRNQKVMGNGCLALPLESRSYCCVCLHIPELCLKECPVSRVGEKGAE